MSRTCRLIVIAFAVLHAAACAASRGADAVGLSMAGPWDMIAFEVRSWGRPVTSWRLLRSGSGSWTVINTSGVTLGQMAFADLDGDGSTDIFRAGAERWLVSWGGQTGWRRLRVASS